MSLQSVDYIMESEIEIERLELKTEPGLIREQALWAGLGPGDRVADIGCGPGKTTAELHDIVGPTGSAVGIDVSGDRIAYARRRYHRPGLDFLHRDFRMPATDLAPFDFIWVRFILQYYRTSSLEIVEHLSGMLKPGGVVCLLDIDQSCMCHYGMPENITRTIEMILGRMEKEKQFDRNAGRKLYSYLYDLGFSDIDVRLYSDHMIHGDLDTVNAFNLRGKIDIAARLYGRLLEEAYPGGYTRFMADFDNAVAQPRRFIYAPLIACRGKKAEAAC